MPRSSTATAACWGAVPWSSPPDSSVRRPLALKSVVCASLRVSGQAPRAAARAKARLTGVKGQLGAVAIRAIADLGVTEGNRPEDITRVTRPGTSFEVAICKGPAVFDQLAP
jgi:hypothetical protein